MIELFKILEGITPNYLSDLFVKADTPYDTRDKNKLIQPLKRTTTYGLRSFQYYGAHVWNMLPISIKTAHLLEAVSVILAHNVIGVAIRSDLKRITLLAWIFP